MQKIRSAKTEMVAGFHCYVFLSHTLYIVRKILSILFAMVISVHRNVLFCICRPLLKKIVIVTIHISTLEYVISDILHLWNAFNSTNQEKSKANLYFSNYVSELKYFPFHLVKANNTYAHDRWQHISIYTPIIVHHYIIFNISYQVNYKYITIYEFE